jgi:hypothetical protein
MGMPSIAVDGDTEAEAITNVKIALESQLATGKIVTISVDSQPYWLEVPNREQPDRAVRDWQTLRYRQHSSTQPTIEDLHPTISPLPS